MPFPILRACLPHTASTRSTGGSYIVLCRVKQLYLTEHSRDFKSLQFYEGLARMRGALNKCEYATAFDIDGYMKRMRGEV